MPDGSLTNKQRYYHLHLVDGSTQSADLYATCGDKVYKRKTRAKGVFAFNPSVKPPQPRL
jgi:hypothetical protein